MASFDWAESSRGRKSLPPAIGLVLLGPLPWHFRDLKEKTFKSGSWLPLCAFSHTGGRMKLNDGPVCTPGLWPQVRSGSCSPYHATGLLTFFVQNLPMDELCLCVWKGKSLQTQRALSFRLTLSRSHLSYPSCCPVSTILFSCGDLM